MTFKNKLFFNQNLVSTSVVVIIILIAITLYFKGVSNDVETQIQASNVSSVVSMHIIKTDSGTAVRTADGNTYIVRAESGGRVNSVARVGDTVTAGAVVAQLENSAQRAAYIQAEGVYDAAVAASGGNTTSQETSKQDAVRTWYNETVNSEQVIYTAIDKYFLHSRNSTIVGFRELDSFGKAMTFNERRLVIEDILKAWDSKTTQINENNIEEMLGSLREDLLIIGTFIDDIASLVPRQRISESYTEENRNTDTVLLASARAGITESQRKVDNALTAIISSSGSNAAMSNAQVKQALGVLESARAALNKTIVKSPISGTITAVSISVGDIINIGSDVVFIAINDDTESVNNSIIVPLTAVKFTPTKAYVFTVVDSKLVANEVKTGLVTSNSIAIEGLFNISEIVSDVRGLKEGDVVSVK